MPKFLNHLDLNANQLKNAKLEVTDSPTQAKGIIHYHSTSNSVRVYTGTGNSDYFTLGDNDVATSSSAGIVELFSDTVQNTAANSVTDTASRTYGIQFNSAGQMVVNVPWTDSSALTTEQVQDIIGGGILVHSNHTGITATYDDANNELDLAVDGVLQDLDTLGAPGSDGQVIVATGAGAFQYESGATLRTTIGVDAAGTDNSTDVTLATVSNNYLSISGQAITAGTVPVSLGGTGSTTASGARSALGVDAAGTDNSTNVTLATVSNNYLSISGQAITAGTVPISLGGTGQTTAANAANALLNVSQGGALTIGDGSDTITIAGNLTVQGTQTTIDSSTVATGDNMLELAKDNSANATDFGWYGKFVDSGTKYAGMHWDASDTKFRLGYGDDVPGGTVTWDTAGHLAVGTITSTDFVIGGHTISDIDTGTEFVDADDHLMSAGAIKEKIESYSYVTDANVTHRSVTAGGNTLANGESLDFVAGTGISISETGGDVTITNTVTNTNTMGSGFTVSATTDSNATTITQGDDLFFAAGTGITCETTADGTVTITNTVTDTNLSIASVSEAEEGSNNTKAMTPARVAARSVIATIDVSDSTFASNLYAEITHGLNTADIIVQLYDINTEQTVEADVYRTDKAGSADLNKIKVVFSAQPASANDIQVLITSCKGGQTGTVAYS